MKKKLYSIFAALLAAVIALPSSVTLPETAFAADGISTEESSTVPTDDPTATLPPRIMNGSFEQPAVTYDELNAFDNEPHQNWMYDGLWYLKSPATLNAMATDENRGNIQNPGFYWKTTSYFNQLEMVLSNKPKDDTMNDVNPANGADEFYPGDDLNGSTTQYCYHPYLNNGEPLNKNLWMKDGNQCAELVPEDQSSLYQNVATLPGARLSWALSHRARTKVTNDTMALFIGPMHEDSQMKKPKEDSKDIFMWMAKLLKAENIVPDFTVRGTNMAAGTYKKCVVYLNPDFSLDENNANYITDSNYRNYISLTPTTTITEKWSCWIMASDVSKWWDYAGKYDVPEGQTATTFAFTALNGERQGGTTKLNQGNLLDDIRFSIAYPLLVSTTTGGQGNVTAQGLDADGEVVNRVEVKYNQDHDNDYVDGTHVTISAIPNPKDLNQEFVFLGANVDGVYVPARNLDGTYNTKDYTITEDKTQFSLNIIMDRPHAVQLIFFAKGKIIYDPNGGTYNGNKEPTMVNMSAGGEDITTSGNTFDKTKNYQKWDNPIGDAIPSDSENMNFIGWFFARGNSNKGGIIKSDHTVVYDGNTGIDDNTIDKFNVTYTTGEGTDEKTETVEVKYGITFIAQYEYLQKDIAQTAKTDNIGSTDKIVYENSIDGGTVSLSIKDFDDKSDTGTAGTDIEYGEGANCGQKGFGRLRDTVTMTATANSGYTFMGWYDESGNLVQHGKTLVYNVDKAHTYYARFKKNEGIRYVSFVAESNENSMPSDTPFSEGSHVRGYIYIPLRKQIKQRILLKSTINQLQNA